MKKVQRHTSSGKIYTGDSNVTYIYNHSAFLFLAGIHVTLVHKAMIYVQYLRRATITMTAKRLYPDPMAIGMSWVIQYVTATNDVYTSLILSAGTKPYAFAELDQALQQSSSMK